METVTVSPKFQVVIPRAVRQSLGIKPGQKVQMIVYGDRIELVPLKPVKKLRGFLRGLDTTIHRESDRL
jgi:AbrB family looped-hinge helix DNA binding protein